MSARTIGIFFDIAIYLIVVIIFYRNLKSPRYKLTKVSHLLVFFLLLIFCLFPYFSGDYFHNMEGYYYVLKGEGTSVEDIYSLIANVVGENYTLFRMVTWGVSLFLVFRAFKRLDVSTDLCLMCFAILGILKFSYARVSIAMALMFYGLSWLIKPNKKILIPSLLWGLIMIAVSYFFHKSALFGIAIIVLTLLIGNINNRIKQFLLLLSLPLFLALMRYLMFNFTDILDISEDNLLFGQTTFELYTEAREGTAGTGQMIENILNRVPIYLAAFLGIKVIYKRNIRKKSIRVFSSAFILIVLISSLFLFDFMDLNTYVFYYRCLNFSFIPMAVLVAYCYQKRLERNLVSLILGLGIVGAMYQMLYSAYIAD